MPFKTNASRRAFFAKKGDIRPQKPKNEKPAITIDTKSFNAEAGISKYGTPYGKLGFGWKKSKIGKN